METAQTIFEAKDHTFLDQKFSREMLDESSQRSVINIGFVETIYSRKR